MPRRPTAHPSARVSARPDAGPAPTAAVRTAADVLLALRAVCRELRLAERAVADGAGLPPAQAHVLRALGQHRAASLGELARRTHADASSVSVVVQRLVELGLVVRLAGVDDRRRTELDVTARGRAWLARWPVSAEARLHDALALMGEAQATTLARRLGRLARAFHTVNTPGPRRGPGGPSRSPGGPK